MNFNSLEYLSYLDRVLDPNGLGGLIVEGVSFPKSIEDYVSRLKVNGSALLEVYSDHSDQVKVIESLSNQPQFEVQLIHLETFIRYGEIVPVQQKLYLVRRLVERSVIVDKE